MSDDNLQRQIQAAYETVNEGADLWNRIEAGLKEKEKMPPVKMTYEKTTEISRQSRVENAISISSSRKRKRIIYSISAVVAACLLLSIIFTVKNTQNTGNSMNEMQPSIIPTEALQVTEIPEELEDSQPEPTDTLVTEPENASTPTPEPVQIMQLKPALITVNGNYIITYAAKKIWQTGEVSESQNAVLEEFDNTAAKEKFFSEMKEYPVCNLGDIIPIDLSSYETAPDQIIVYDYAYNSDTGEITGMISYEIPVESNVIEMKVPSNISARWVSGEYDGTSKHINRQIHLLCRFGDNVAEYCFAISTSDAYDTSVGAVRKTEEGFELVRQNTDISTDSSLTSQIKFAGYLENPNHNEPSEPIDSWGMDIKLTDSSIKWIFEENEDLKIYDSEGQPITAEEVNTGDFVKVSYFGEKLDEYPNVLYCSRMDVIEKYEVNGDIKDEIGSAGSVSEWDYEVYVNDDETGTYIFNKSITIDLDGDGNDEEISVNLMDYSANSVVSADFKLYHLRINNYVFQPSYFAAPDETYFHIIDLDTNDGYKEIAFRSTAGDAGLYMYRYENGGLTYVGFREGLPDVDSNVQIYLHGEN